MKRILCYGDSNTWGFISGSDRQRYNENERWTKLLQKLLGEGYEVIEEGLNSRTLMTESNSLGHDGRNKAGRNGFTYLYPCLDTHDKFDVFVLMLGTNEMKNKFKNSAEDTLKMIEKYADVITNYTSQIDGSSPKLVIMGIPQVVEEKGESAKTSKFFGASEKAQKFNKLLEEYCNSNGITFVNNSDLEVGVDGVHLSLESHKKLAEKLYLILK